METPVKYGKILAATDGSRPALSAGRHAVYLAKSFGGEVIVLNVVDTTLAFRSGLHYSKEVADLEISGMEATAKIKALCDEAGVPVREMIVSGTPHAVILQVACDERVDLIVMGSVGMTAIERTLLGSVSERVTHHASCPVLLVREQ